VDEGIGGWWCEAVSLGLHPLDSSSDSVRKFALFGLWPHDLSSATVCMYMVIGRLRTLAWCDFKVGRYLPVSVSKGIVQLLTSHPNSQRYIVTTVLRQAA
jgi:hypothetical protein